MNRKAWGQSGLMKAAVVLALLGWVLVPASAALGKTLCYNGDWDPPPYLNCSNNIITGSGWAIGYDDFEVPAPGWVIAGLWADINAWGSPIHHPTIKVMWSIRSGCAPGGPAGLESVGVEAWGEGQASVTPSADTNYTYRIQVDGLFLPIGPGTYWLSLTPYDVEAYNLRTSGENAVGNPPGNNDSSLWASSNSSDGNFIRLYDRPTLYGDPPYTPPIDLAMGINGRVLPGARLPGTVLLLGSGLLGLAGRRRGRKS